jgi:hypothetical protein
MAEKTTKKDDPRSAKMQLIMHEIEKPFPADKIQTRKGKSGKEYKYIKNQEYIKKLNDIFGTAWSSREVESMFIGNNYVVKKVEICVPDPDNPGQVWCRDGWGGHPFTGDYGEAMKSANSKAFVKAAMAFGIGLQLKGIESDDYEEGELPAIPTNMTVVNPGPHNMPPVPVAPKAPAIPVVAAAPVVPNVPTPAPFVPTNGAIPLPPSGMVKPNMPNPPTFVNQAALENMQPFPPAAPMPPAPPVPTGNPSVVPSAVGLSGGDGRPITAAINLGSLGAEADNQPIAEFQVNSLKGEAIVRGIADPMELVKLVMGPAGVNITSINQLTVKQAQDILTTIRQMPPGATS